MSENGTTFSEERARMQKKFDEDLQAKAKEMAQEVLWPNSIIITPRTIRHPDDPELLEYGLRMYKLGKVD